MVRSETLPHDPALPQLAQALDGAAMAAVFGAQLVRHRVERCEVERVKYRPRRNLAVAYRLALRDRVTGAAAEQCVATRFCSGGEALRRARKAQAFAAAPTPAGPACTHDPALDMVAHWWPNDPKLGVAAQLLGDPARLARDALPGLVAALSAGRGRLIAHRSALSQLVPEQRVSARVELAFEPVPGAPAQSCVVYAKADAERRGGVTHAVMAALCGSLAATQGRLITPQPLLWQPVLGLQWQAALPGRMLLDAQPALRADTSARVGSLLAALHATPVPAARRCDFAALRLRIATVIDTLAQVDRSWSGALAALGARLAAGVDRLRGLPNVTLHGDLHPRNLLIEEGRLGLIDLDGVRQGPALLDLGDWVADALYRALLAGTPLAAALPGCRAFVAAYAGAARLHPAEPALAWSVAHSLLSQRAWRCVVNLKPGRYVLVPALLALADALLREGSLDAAAMPLREAA